jgi:hypothetical protein
MTAWRILIVTPDKGLAETILRGLRDIGEPPVEVDVVFSRFAALDRVRASRYDLLIAGIGVLGDDHESDAGVARVPVLTVGGPPDADGRASRDAWRVPLPLSFGLLLTAVREALGPAGPPVPDGAGIPGVRTVAD